MSTHFPEVWQIRPPRPFVYDPSTGNRRPGGKPNPVPVNGLLQQRFPRTEQSDVGTSGGRLDERTLLLDPKIVADLGRDLTTDDVAIGPDDLVWHIDRAPVPRRPVRGRRTPRYLAVMVRRATDIKES